jgi:hypothetical protein
MNMPHRSIAILLMLTGLGLVSTSGQSPAPIIVQAANSTPIPVTNVVTPTVESNAAAIKMLQELKAANEEMVKKQQAVIAELDELAKTAEQLRTFAKRG